MPFNDTAYENYLSGGGGSGGGGGPPISTFAMNSTMSAYKELVSLKESNSEQYKQKKEVLDANWEKISKAESRLLILNSFLTFSPTFIFGVLIYSLITSPQNWIGVSVFFGIFLIFMGVATTHKIVYQTELYKLGQAQEDLKQEIKNLKK